MKLMINSKEKSVNHPIHVVHTDIDSFILCSYINSVDDESQLVEISEVPKVMSSIHEAITTKGKEVGEECMQPTNPIEEIQRIVQKTKSFETAIQNLEKQKVQSSEILFPDAENGLWTMEFDGASRREGARIGVWIHGPLH